MGRIYCLMGKSAPGKDSIYRRLKDIMPALHSYVMYTTRPMREGEKDGVSYNFIDTQRLEEAKSEGRLIESRTYETVCGPWTYATIDDGQLELECGDYLMPATIESYEALKKYYGAEHVLPIYIETDDGERLCRALERERKERQPKYKELCRRFIADSEDFSEGKLCKAGITRRFVNDDLERCVSEIAVFIRETKGQRDLAG